MTAAQPQPGRFVVSEGLRSTGYYWVIVDTLPRHPLVCSGKFKTRAATERTCAKRNAAVLTSNGTL